MTLLQMYPYWYYNDEVGYGPENIVISVTRDEDDAITDSSCDSGWEWCPLGCDGL